MAKPAAGKKVVKSNKTSEAKEKKVLKTLEATPAKLKSGRRMY